MGYIYCITNNVNGKKYVGKTIKTLEDRFKDHEINSKRYDYVLYKAFRKYGIDNFTITKIGEFPDEQLDIMETHFIKELDTYIPNGYNMTLGGDGMLGYTHTEETKQKLRESTQRVMNNLTEEEKEKRFTSISRALSGRRKSKEHRQNLGKSRRKLIREGKIPVNFKGCSHTDEAKEKNRLAHLGKESVRRIPLVCTDGEKTYHFVSYMEASLWLIANGYTKSKNRTSVTSTIKESVTSGKKRYGFNWSLVE